MKLVEDIKFLEQGKDLLKKVVERDHDESNFMKNDSAHLNACKNIVEDIDTALRETDKNISSDDIKDLKTELVRCLNEEAYPFLTQDDYYKRDELLSKFDIDDINEKEL